MDSLTQQHRFIVDASWRRPDDGRVIFAGSPIKMFRLSAGGKNIAALIEAGQALPSGHQSLTARLLDAGAIHPLVTVGETGPYSLNDITVVIPAFVQSQRDATMLGDLIQQCTGVGRIVVVDDASTHSLTAPEHLLVITLATNSGPGAARNAGLDHVTTPLVAFVDLDVALSATTLTELLPLFVDTKLGVAAPRIRCDDSGVKTNPGTIADYIAEYESTRSPLDLGDVAARIAPGTRVSYVPTAVWLCRTEAIRGVSGFDVEMRVGEDVDALWRVIAAGWHCRYAPNAVATHAPRPTLQDFVQQRRRYGRSAAALAARHQGAVAPVRVSGYSAGAWLLVACGLPFIGLLVGAYTVVALSRKLRAVPNAMQESLRLAGLGNLHAAQILASAITRTWWPIALTLAIFSRRARRVVLVAAVAPAMYEWWSQQPAIDPLRYLALRLIDDVSYGLGVWEGAVAARSAEALMPDLSSWPKRDS